MASLHSSLFVAIIVVVMASALLASSAAPTTNSSSGGKPTNSSAPPPSSNGTGGSISPALSPAGAVVDGGAGSPLPAGTHGSDGSSAGSPADAPSPKKSAASGVKLQISAVLAIVLGSSFLLQ